MQWCVCHNSGCSTTTLRRQRHSQRAAADVSVVCRAACLAYVYLPGHIGALAIALPYCLSPLTAAPAIATTQAALLAAYYVVTLRGNPALTGCREWPSVVAWLQAHLGPALAAWMRGCEVCVPEFLVVCTLFRMAVCAECGASYCCRQRQSVY